MDEQEREPAAIRYASRAGSYAHHARRPPGQVRCLRNRALACALNPGVQGIFFGNAKVRKNTGAEVIIAAGSRGGLCGMPGKTRVLSRLSLPAGRRDVRDLSIRIPIIILKRGIL